MIYYFTKGTLNAGSSRHRAFFWCEQLQLNGVDSMVIVPPIFDSIRSRWDARWYYLKTIFGLRSDDIVVLQTTIFNRLFIVLMFVVKTLFKPKIIFDFDDALYTLNPIATKALVLLADRVIVASHYLASWKGVRGKKVLIMSNLINVEYSSRFQTSYHSTTPVILGWIGGAFGLSLVNLGILKPVFERLIKDGLPFRFRLIGALGKKEAYDFIHSIHGLDAEIIDRIDWAKPGEIQKANASFDIGLCPLVENEINRARCSLKILDYMIAGLPVVASRIGENTYFIEDGISGILASSTEEWVQALTNLIQHHEERKRLGTHARDRIQSVYNYKAQIPVYLHFLQENK